MRFKFTSLLKIVVGFLILFFLFYKIGLGDIYSTLLKTNLLYVLVYLILLFLLFVIGTINIKILLRPFKTRIPFLRLLRYYMASWSAGLFIPGRIGEFLLAYFLKKNDIEYGKGVIIPLMDRVLAFIALAIFAIIGAFIFFTINDAIKIVITLVVLLIIFYFVFINSFGRRIIRKYILRKYASRFEGFYDNFKKYLKNKRVISLAFLNTVIKQVLTAITIYSLFLAFNTHINPFYIIIMHSVIVILSFIPISINGLGVKEASAVVLYSLIGVKPEITLSTYIIMTVITYIFAIINLSAIKYKEIIKEIQ